MDFHRLIPQSGGLCVQLTAQLAPTLAELLTLTVSDAQARTAPQLVYAAYAAGVRAS